MEIWPGEWGLGNSTPFTHPSYPLYLLTYPTFTINPSTLSSLSAYPPYLLHLLTPLALSIYLPTPRYARLQLNSSTTTSYSSGGSVSGKGAGGSGGGKGQGTDILPPSLFLFSPPSFPFPRSFPLLPPSPYRTPHTPPTPSFNRCYCFLTTLFLPLHLTITTTLLPPNPPILLGIYVAIDSLQRSVESMMSLSLYPTTPLSNRYHSILTTLSSPPC